MLVENHDDGDNYCKEEQGLSDPRIRLGFIRKVYSILSVQLVFTCCFCLLAMNSPMFASLFINPTVLIAAIVGYICSICALACCRMDTKVPINFILLGIFTLCTSTLVACVCMRYDQTTVIEAASLTAAMVVGITFYAATTKTDFTICGAFAFVLGFAFVWCSLLAFIFVPNMRLLWCFLGVILFSFYLLIDTQLIIGGSKV